MASNNIRDLDTDIRVSVLEPQVNSLTSGVDKIEKKMEDNYVILHERINDLGSEFEHKNEKIIVKLALDIITKFWKKLVKLKNGDG